MAGSSSSLEQGGKAEICIGPKCAHLNGLQIKFVTGTSVKISTLGGVVYVDGVPHAISAIHPFEPVPDNDMLPDWSTPSSSPDFSTDADDEDEDFLFEGPCWNALGTLDSFGPIPSLPIVNTMVASRDLLPSMSVNTNAWIPFGQISCWSSPASTNQAASTMDGMLISLHNWFQALPNGYISDIDGIEVDICDSDPTIPSPGTQVTVLAGVGGTQDGLLGQQDIPMVIGTACMAVTQVILAKPLGRRDRSS